MDSKLSPGHAVVHRFYSGRRQRPKPKNSRCQRCLLQVARTGGCVPWPWQGLPTLQP